MNHATYNLGMLFVFLAVFLIGAVETLPGDEYTYLPHDICVDGRPLHPGLEGPCRSYKFSFTDGNGEFYIPDMFPKEPPYWAEGIKRGVIVLIPD